MRETENLLLRAAKLLELPADAVAGKSHIEIIGTRDAIIENHKGILEYGDTTLSLNLGTKILTLEGANLKISAMDERGLRLSGEITSVRFESV
ncbi:MAG: sporulation protein [Clostridia bacterium]|nr:sporulation protein [Clostridia bacterium]